MRSTVTKDKQRAMAGFYGMQFEALMKEVCEDFGRKLLRGWDENAPKEEMREYVRESVDAFFAHTKGLNGKKVVTLEVEKVDEESRPDGSEIKPKKKAPAKGKAKKKAPEPEPEISEAEIEEEKPKAKAKGKAHAKKKEAKVEKPKCEAVTAKGTQCSKCAMEGEVFCSVHLKKKEEEGGGEEKKAKAPAKKKGGAKKKEELKHTHEMGEKPEEECELCETHGEAFELPEYEMEDEEVDDTAGDPDWRLEEEDFEDD